MSQQTDSTETSRTRKARPVIIAVIAAAVAAVLAVAIYFFAGGATQSATTLLICAFAISIGGFRYWRATK